MIINYSLNIHLFMITKHLKQIRTNSMFATIVLLFIKHYI